MQIMNAQLGHEGKKLRSTKCLSEYVNQLCMSGDISRLNVPISNLISHKVTINLDMFCSFMKDWVFGNVESCLAITIDMHGWRIRDTKTR